MTALYPSKKGVLFNSSSKKLFSLCLARAKETICFRKHNCTKFQSVFFTVLGCIAANGWRVLLKMPTLCTATSFIDLLERARIDKLSGYIVQDDNCSILRAEIVNQ